ncbi:hypothetical protein KY333_04615 [Candidatus Woesearchaeota archaeon]|nr:hypothetical protein [Candidatus Woesearchaeota archaeon]
MRKQIIFALLSVLILLAACSPMEQECEKPFISKDGGCCLDMDEDGSCDVEADSEKTKDTDTTKDESSEVVVEETEPLDVKTVDVEINETAEGLLPDDGDAEDEVEETEEVEETPKESASINASTLVGQLMKTYTEEVESYKYFYHSNWYHVLGNDIKITLSNSQQFSAMSRNGSHYPVVYVDTIYMNLINKTTTGYCEGSDPNLGLRRCAELELVDLPYPLSYANYYTKRPDEWLFEVYTMDPDVKTETGYYYLGPRKVKRLEYTQGIIKTIMYYDEKIGLPVKVEQYVNDQFSKLWLYDFLSINTVKAKHVRHRTADEISSKEEFYSTAN